MDLPRLLSDAAGTNDKSRAHRSARLLFVFSMDRLGASVVFELILRKGGSIDLDTEAGAVGDLYHAA